MFEANRTCSGLGKGASTLVSYFERNGAPACPKGANPAEWMLQVIKPPADGYKGFDWHQIWRGSPEYQAVKKELGRLRALPASSPPRDNAVHEDGSQHEEFVSPFRTQFLEVLLRTAKHFWRSPTYIWSKIILIALSVSGRVHPITELATLTDILWQSLYLGFSFKADNSIQGLQNQLWAIFMLLVLFININEQAMPMFVPQRALYEVRERPSKMYRWTGKPTMSPNLTERLEANSCDSQHT